MKSAGFGEKEQVFIQIFGGLTASSNFARDKIHLHV